MKERLENIKREALKQIQESDAPEKLNERCRSRGTSKSWAACK